MDGRDIEIQRLNGELHLAAAERDWWAEEMLFWRTKYLLEHPDLAIPDYVHTAREDEKIDPMLFL